MSYITSSLCPLLSSLFFAGICRDERDKRESPVRLNASKASPAPTPNRGMFGRLSLIPKPHPEKAEERQQWQDVDEDEALAMGFSLESLIQTRRWRTVLARLTAHPIEAEGELELTTRGGFAATSGMTPLHYACERKPPVEVVEELIAAHPAAVTTRAMPGGALPLHISCTWYGSPDVVRALLSADQTASAVTDELGNLALHCACFSGAHEQVVSALLDANGGKAVLARNHQGSRPIDICRRLRHDNRRAVMALLTMKKEEILAKHQRNSSSGTWTESASLAAELNDQSERSRSGNGFREGDDLQEQGAIGIEVQYEDENLVWI